MEPKPKGRNIRRQASEAAADARGDPAKDLLIAGVGASAGGVEALTELVSHLPCDTGMAFVLIQHLAPKHHSLLTELLARKTAMTVEEAVDGIEVEPNHIYVIPPNASMTISDHRLKIGPREESGGMHMSIDHFMRALAEQQKNRAIGVILSGAGTDGTLGMAEIQAQGGVTFAQDEASAKYSAMPRSAVAAGCVDYVLPPKGIARELTSIARHPYVARRHSSDAADPAPSKSVALSAVFQALRKTTGVDFTHYRETTTLRRIQRRMVVHKLEKLEEYAKLLQINPVEIKSLYQDILINVTGFFRNARAFDALKTEVFPDVLKNHRPQTSIRIWTPGCASGEETYSVAISLLEFLGDKTSQIPIQVFGTDVSDSSVSKARRGLYPENIQADVSAERLKRYFNKVEGGYRISKNIRDMCVFAQHNLLNDPPFSQIDLICCRNLLIYLEPILQSRAISLFHYATRVGGFLLLGTSEGVGTPSHLFAPVDRTQKIFSKKNTATRQTIRFALNHSSQPGDYSPNRIPAKQTDASCV
jgi:two-component system CheB/CheR fusion protein